VVIRPARAKKEKLQVGIQLIQIRQAHPRDYPLFLEFIGWLELPPGEPTRPPEDWEKDFMASTLFLEEGGREIGYAVIQPLKPVGYIRQLVIRPEARRRGLASKFMLHIARRFRRSVATSCGTNVCPNNTLAVRLYEKMGLSGSDSTEIFRLDRDSTARLPDPDRMVQVRPLLPEDDSAVEAVWGLVPGLLSDSRRTCQHHLLRLVDSDDAADMRVGLDLFAPGLPGAFPFRAASPCLARPLLDHLWFLASVDSPWVQVVVEGDPALGSAFRTAGAEQVMNLLHMEGPLPSEASGAQDMASGPSRPPNGDQRRCSE